MNRNCIAVKIMYNIEYLTVPKAVQLINHQLSLSMIP